MPLRLLAQLLLASSLFQIFPPDAGTVERYATLPEASNRGFATIEQTLSLLHTTLPQASEASRAPVKVEPTSVGVVTSAQSAIVVDRVTGEVLYEKNGTDPRSIGSISKLMTAHVFLEGQPDLSAAAAIQPEDVREGGTQHVAIGDVVTIKDLLTASLVASDNSATQALVRLSGMPEGEFIGRMNEAAAEMGMLYTTFMDPTGLSSDNRSVVRDVAHLIDTALKNDVIRETTELPVATFTSASGRVYTVKTTDELLSTFLNEPPYNVVGGKTGFLPEAGYCLGTLISENNAHELIVVVLGSETKEGRFRDVKALAAWAYKVFAWPDEQTTESS